MKALSEIQTSKQGRCRTISEKPTGIEKEKDIPRLPEN